MVKHGRADVRTFQTTIRAARALSLRVNGIAVDPQETAQDIRALD